MAVRTRRSIQSASTCRRRSSAATPLGPFGVVVWGLDYSGFVGSETIESAGVATSSLIKGKYDPARMATYTVVAVTFTVLAALYPAVYVARLRPVDAMRHV